MTHSSLVCLFALLLGSCTTFQRLEEPRDSGSGDLDGAAGDASADVDDGGPGDVGPDVPLIDLGARDMADLPPLMPYDDTPGDDFFESDPIPVSSPSSLTLSVEETGYAYAAWAEDDLLRAFEVQLGDLPGGDLTPAFATDFVPEGATLVNPQIRLWYLGAGQTAISITSHACTDGGGTGLQGINWRNEHFPNNAGSYLSDPADCDTDTDVEARSPIITGGHVDDVPRTSGSYAYAFLRGSSGDAHIIRRDAVDGESDTGFDCPMPAACDQAVNVPTATSLQPILTHGSRTFFWEENLGAVYQTSLFEDEFASFEEEEFVSDARPGIAYLGRGFERDEKYAVFRTDPGPQLIAHRWGSDGEHTIVAAADIQHLSAVPVPRGAGTADLNLVVVANVERVGGVKYFAQRVVSFDDGVQVIACRRRVFPGGVTKEDLQVGAFIRSGDLFAVGLTQFDNGSQAMVVEGFRFPNLGLPRDEVLRRADPTCQDFDPLDP